MVGFLRGATRSIGDLAGRSLKDFFFRQAADSWWATSQWWDSWEELRGASGIWLAGPYKTTVGRQLVGNQLMVGFLRGATRSIRDLVGRALRDYCRQTSWWAASQWWDSCEELRGASGIWLAGKDYCRQTAGGQPANGWILARSYEEHRGFGWQVPKRVLSPDS